MWLLDSTEDVLQGRKVWLRPGKLYLFGRSAADACQFILADKSISRKHLIIQVDDVPQGDGVKLRTRSRITVEDLNTKKGTELNGKRIRGEKHQLESDSNVLQLGMANKRFRITWHPVVFSFSYNAKQLRADPWTKVRESLEQLDIKYSAEYEHALTSHVVSKKRNTSKGLQALISGKYIVADSFIAAVVDATVTPAEEGATAVSPLETDFERNWPNALKHLPPRGQEPTERPDDAYGPDEKRAEVFDGYAFIFYEKKQYENLFSAIASGKGQALLREVVPGETDADDFVRYVNGLAEEKGVGSFQDGIEGKRVVVVRFVPAQGPDQQWYVQFLTAFATRLDHRPIDQRDFLDAILACDAGTLHRPLQMESQPESTKQDEPSSQNNTIGEGRMETDRPVPRSETLASRPSLPHDQHRLAKRPRGQPRRTVGSRFRGFVLDEPEDVPAVAAETPISDVLSAFEDSQIASQGPSSEAASASSYDGCQVEREATQQPSERHSCKRAHSPISVGNNSAIIDDIAPTAALVKRRRIEAGEVPIPNMPQKRAVDDAEMEQEIQTKTRGQQIGKGGCKKADTNEFLELVRQKRDEREAKAAAERKELGGVPEDEIDYAAIRSLHIVEECEVRFPERKVDNDSRERDVANGRWDPRWNGRRNFKRFRKQGEEVGRPAPRIIIAVGEVKPKEYGISDDYWLEDEETRKETQMIWHSQAPEKQERSTTVKTSNRGLPLPSSSDEEEDGEEGGGEPVVLSQRPEAPAEHSRSRVGRSASAANLQRGQSPAQTRTQRQGRPGKRAAAVSPAAACEEQQAKRPRRSVIVGNRRDDSDDDMKFRFGRRR